MTTKAKPGTRRVDSPFENYPGYILVPEDLTPEQFDTWWQVTSEIENDEEDVRAPEYRMFQERYPLVIEWHVEGLDVPWEQVKGDARKLPAVKLAAFVISATQQCIVEARSLPSLPKPSSDGTTAKRK